MLLNLASNEKCRYSLIADLFFGCFWSGAPSLNCELMSHRALFFGLVPGVGLVEVFGYGWIRTVTAVTAFDIQTNTVVIPLLHRNGHTSVPLYSRIMAGHVVSVWAHSIIWIYANTNQSPIGSYGGFRFFVNYQLHEQYARLLNCFSDDVFGIVSQW